MNREELHEMWEQFTWAVYTGCKVITYVTLLALAFYLAVYAV